MLRYTPPMITRSQDRTEVGANVGPASWAPRTRRPPPQLLSERHSALAQVIGDVVSCPAVMYVAPT